MNDRELLELAAKAAGIAIMPCACKNEKWPFKHSVRGGHWNPLTDDGDALRLAVSLGLVVDCAYQAARQEVSDGEWVYGHPESGPYSATRRAIVRAAAEIGRAMP